MIACIYSSELPWNGKASQQCVLENRVQLDCSKMRRRRYLNTVYFYKCAILK